MISALQIFLAGKRGIRIFGSVLLAGGRFWTEVFGKVKEGTKLVEMMMGEVVCCRCQSIGFARVEEWWERDG